MRVFKGTTFLADVRINIGSIVWWGCGAFERPHVFLPTVGGNPMPLSWEVRVVTWMFKLLWRRLRVTGRAVVRMDLDWSCVP